MPDNKDRSKVRHFRSPAEFRTWLQEHHSSAQVLWVGYYKVDSGKPSITYSESLDEALCVGWIDGIRKSLDDVSYCIRFTPRKKGSNWSVVNVRRVKALIKEGRMRPQGLAAFNARQPARVGIYSYEQRPADLPEPYRGVFRKNKAAWDFLCAQSPSYRKGVTWWIVSAKKEETRLARLQKLVEACAARRKVAQMVGEKRDRSDG